MDQFEKKRKKAAKTPDDVFLKKFDAMKMEVYEDWEAVTKDLELQMWLGRTHPSRVDDNMCYPVLLTFLNSLEDLQWRFIRRRFWTSYTRASFAKISRRIVCVVAHTVSQVLLPALKILLDLEVAERKAPGSGWKPSILNDSAQAADPLQEYFSKTEATQYNCQAVAPFSSNRSLRQSTTAAEDKATRAAGIGDQALKAEAVLERLNPVVGDVIMAIVEGMAAVEGMKNAEQGFKTASLLWELATRMDGCDQEIPTHSEDIPPVAVSSNDVLPSSDSVVEKTHGIQLFPEDCCTN